MQQLETHKEWKTLIEHQQQISNHKMLDWFDQDLNRFERFSLQVGEVFLDYSKNLITTQTIQLLCDLAHRAHLPQKIEALFTGQIVNLSEQRPALHTALRAYNQPSLFLNGKNILEDIRNTLNKMSSFIERIHNHSWLSVTKKPIRHIVNIGIGGSHLGPLMATHALTDFAREDLSCHFISNIDSAHIKEVLNQIDPETTLFIISSKSFTTLETITNSITLRSWLQNRLGKDAFTRQFVAVTGAKEKALEFGIPDENIFELWDFVGGRYSIWSAIGLPLALMIGMKHFYEFLDGAREMDNHFQNQPLDKNMPVILGLLNIWYINFFNVSHYAIIPYSHHLNYFRTHLQQLEMESNGKNITEFGFPVSFLTSPVILGEQGCNGQHAFHQLLHQGQHLIPVDFILTGNNQDDLTHHHDILIGSALSQSEALMRGKTYHEALNELLAEGYSKDMAEHLAKHKTIPGNRPNNTLFLNRITPKNLGALLSLYEHKTFVQAIIWQINSFDQWGVELGKKLLPSILNALNSSNNNQNQTHDSSTQGLIRHYQNLRKILC